MKTTNDYTLTLREAARALDRAMATQLEARATLREANRRVRIALEALAQASRQHGTKEAGR